ncbi:MAG TPA: asparagine synthase (glutamine-hydrolyzing), partial [Segetibacter sp.]
MCGIAGILSENSNNVSRQQLQKMTDAIKHRGPEGDGFWINPAGTVGLGHRRLSIIDLSNAGAQPMHYQDRFTITYNGELYNYLEIKEELLKKDFAFNSHCDTEVILAAYACYGEQCLAHFDGMFAFAIWDEKEKTLFCARDRFGEKPFYYSYSHVNHQLVFASEMKGLWAAGIYKKMDNQMLLNYLTLGWVQNPTDKQQTFFEEILSLPPAHYLLCKLQPNKDTFLQIKSYWDLDKESQQKPSSAAAAKTNFLDLFNTSVSRRLRSDVAIGSSLSGGLDSSSIVATIHRLLGNATHQKTFSAVFPGFAKDESKHIAEVVAKFGVENYHVIPNEEDFIKDFEKLIYHQEEPFQSASIYAQYKVYELAKQHGVTVILDGQGADEILAGYTKYYHWFLQEKIAHNNWKEAKQELNLARQNGQQINWGIKNYVAAFMPQLAANQLQKSVIKQQKNHPDISTGFLAEYANKANIYKPAISKLNDVLYFNTMQSGLEELLRYADRNSMAHSLEVRLPFLNHALVQFIFNLPSSYKISQGFTKFILRKSMEETLPKTIIWRKDKVGFEPPQKQWLQNKRVVEYLHESRRKLVAQGILKKQVLQKPVYAQDAHEADNFDWR